jgi:hypothetical protein
VFDRRDIAEILGIPPAVVRNWSMGNPFQIEPSIRAPGRRGSANLYALEDLYLFGIAAYLARADMQPRLVIKVLSYVRQHPELLQEQERDVYLAAYAPLHSITDPLALIVIHSSAKQVSRYAKSDFARRFGKLTILIHLGAILGLVDDRIGMLEALRAKPKSKGVKHGTAR